VTDALRLRTDDIEWTEVEDAVVVLDLRDSSYFSLNKTGAALWPELLEGSTREQLVTRLTERFVVDETTASRDVAAFLGSLAERGLLAG
jgi:hypothetical protein